MSLQGTGEEWRAMDVGAGEFDGAASLDIVRRAQENVTRLRMREVEMRFVDRQGKPRAGLAVDIAQSRNAFLVGDQLWSLDRQYRYGEHLTDTVRYYTLRHTQALNACTALCYWTERPRNDGPKSEDIQGDPQMDAFAWCVDWGNANGMTVKGHPLFWSIEKCVPEWVKRYDYATQMKFAEVRIRNLVARFKGKVKIWDAVNEPLWEPAFKDLASRHWPHVAEINDIADYIEPVLRWCNEEDPDATFLVNDYGLEMDGGKAPIAKDGTPVTAAMQRQRALQLLEELNRRGTPPDAFGMQAHTGGWIDHVTQWNVYDELAQAGLPLHVTEFWANQKALESRGDLPQDVKDHMQADYVRNYLTAAFGHPAIDAFFFWGAMNSCVRWGKASSHDLTPMFHAIRGLVHDAWLTKEHLVTDQDGVVRFRGFYGDYAARYQMSAAMTHGVSFAVTKEASMPLTVVAPV
jgi:GH35 family endo-1,4-beta-xylanase